MKPYKPRNLQKSRTSRRPFQNKSAIAVAGTLIWGCLAPVAAAQDEAWVGRRVMVVREGAEFRVPGEASAPAPIGMVLKVSHVNGAWVWFHGQRGWIRTRYLVLQEEAIGYFSAEIERSPTAEAYRLRGVAQVALDNINEAANDFSKAIERDANNVAAYNDRGNALLKLGRLDQALEDFNAIIARDIRHPAVYTNRGLAWHAKGDDGRALADYNAALAIDERFAPAWEAGGAARETQGDFPKAISNYRRAIAADPDFARALNNLAWILATNQNAELRNGQEAVAHAAKACELTGYQDAGYLDTLAAALAEAGRFEDALKRASQAMNLAAGQQQTEIRSRLELYEAGQPYRDQ